MNDSQARELMDAAERLLRPHLEQSEPLRRLIDLCGRWLIDLAQGVDATSADRESVRGDSSRMEAVRVSGAASESGDARSESDSAGPAASAPAATGSRALPRSSGIVPLKLGDAAVDLPLTGTTEEIGRARQAAVESKLQMGGGPAPWPDQGDLDLALVETRCRLKAASCRLFIERRAVGADMEREYETRMRMNEMIATAKSLPNCFLWVFWRERTQPDDARLARIAQNYQALAEAAALMRRVDEPTSGAQEADEIEALQLLAEASSALRRALADTWLTDDDRDQSDVHYWLRRETAQRRIYIERHMTIDDPADPANAPDLLARLGQVARRLDKRAERTKAIRGALSQIRYHARMLLKNGPEEGMAHWTRIADAIDELRRLDVAPTDRRIAEAIGRDAASTCAAQSGGDSALTAAIERARALAEEEAGLEEDGAEPETAARQWSARVLEVRELLRGKHMVIIGGQENARALERFVSAFDLADAEWVVLAEHGPGAPMRAPIRRPETAIVIVIVKLAGHLHAEEARSLAQAAGKPCVLLPGGYNPESVALAILEQASGRLAEAARTA